MPVDRLGIVGAGALGSGIAEVAILRGFPTVLYDVDASTTEQAHARVRASLENRTQRRRLSPGEAEAALARMTPAASLDQLAGDDFVIPSPGKGDGGRARPPGGVFPRIFAMIVNEAAFALQEGVATAASSAIASGARILHVQQGPSWLNQ